MQTETMTIDEIERMTAIPGPYSIETVNLAEDGLPAIDVEWWQLDSAAETAPSRHDEIYLPDFWLDVKPDETPAYFSAWRGLAWLAFCAALFLAGLGAGYASLHRSIREAQVIDVREGVVSLAIGGDVHEFGFKMEGGAE